jgi:hydroxymethylpyrimidine/phosphomethylpyrimidine kinase
MSSLQPRTLLTIAGHDPSSGAGIAADLQVFSAFGHFGVSAITALTVQSTRGVTEVQPVAPHFLARTLDHLIADLPPAGIKIGMLGSATTAETVADFLRRLARRDSKSVMSAEKKGIETGSAEPPHSGALPLPIVLDPILRASSGARLLDPAALTVLHEHLIPAVTWITPNWPELSALTGHTIETLADAEAAANLLADRHPHLHIVATGGDQFPPTDLLRLPSGEIHYVYGEHIASTSTHGTGCAFSSALLSRLILGDTQSAAAEAAKRYVTEAIRRAPGIGHGRGPLNCLWPLA